MKYIKNIWSSFLDGAHFEDITLPDIFFIILIAFLNPISSLTQVMGSSLNPRIEDIRVR